MQYTRYTGPGTACHDLFGTMHDVCGGLSLVVILVHRVCNKCCQSKTNAIADTNLYMKMCVDLLCSHVERRIMPFVAS